MERKLVESPPDTISVHFEPPLNSDVALSEGTSGIVVNGRAVQPHLSSPQKKTTTSEPSSPRIKVEAGAIKAESEAGKSNEFVQRFHLFEFPTAEALSGAAEADLRSLGMGYRAKFIVNSAAMAASKPGGASAWFEGLRALAASDNTGNETHEIKTEIKEEEIVSERKKRRVKSVGRDSSDVEKDGGGPCAVSSRLSVQQQLLEFPGVGRKVADCVALFSLDQSASIPV